MVHDNDEPDDGAENGPDDGPKDEPSGDRGRGTDTYRLRVALDASELEDRLEERPQELQAVARRTDETLQSAPVEFDDCEAVAELTFDEEPGAVGVYVGPETMAAEELIRTQTLTENVPGQRWVETPEIELDPIRIPPYYWDWWRRWCRTFTVTGKLTCPDGSPVPGATVCAKDIDGWFYWQSTQQVGCATTNPDGTFEIEFRWCCGFWPWWWWQHRAWQPDDLLTERIEAATRDVPELSLAKGGHQPGLAVFDDLLEDAPVPVDAPVGEIDPDRLEQVRSELVDRLPRAPELRELGVWPWAPWQPWYDCTPDLVFEATQNGTVVLDEGIADARWNVSTNETVSLTTAGDAICRGGCDQPPCEGGECLLVTDVCGVDVDRIGGNLGANPSPVGYANAVASVGTTARTVDRPFAGRVFLSRSPADIERVDYVELEYDDGSGWTPVPASGLRDFRISYIRYQSGSFSFPDADFAVTDVGGTLVVPTRERYEDTHAPVWSAEKARHGSAVGSVDAWWSGGEQNRLVAIDSTGFADGTYRFRLIGYEAFGSGDDLELEELGPVPRCPADEQEGDVEVTLTFDNRKNVPIASHPHPTAALTPGSGTGTVHRAHVEPDTSITAVRIVPADGGDPVTVPEDDESECPSVAQTDGTLQIDFLARDPVGPDNPVGHLADYDLRATFGRSKQRNLLNKPSSTVSVIGAGSPHTGHQSGDGRGTYGRALDQGASRPDWEGGEYRLEVDLADAFPKPCCYQLELRARKRTIANCHTGWPHWNISEYSIGYGI